MCNLHVDNSAQASCNHSSSFDQAVQNLNMDPFAEGQMNMFILRDNINYKQSMIGSSSPSTQCCAAIIGTETEAPLTIVGCHQIQARIFCAGEGLEAVKPTDRPVLLWCYCSSESLRCLACANFTQTRLFIAVSDALKWEDGYIMRP